MENEAGGAAFDAGTSDAGGAVTEGQSQQSAPWYGEQSDVDLGWMQSKGFDKPDAGPKVIKSLREAERLIGTIKGSPDRIVVMPKDFENQDEVNAYYSKLGRPETPDKYSVYNDTPIMKAVAEKAYKLGVSNEAFKGITEELGQQFEAMEAESIEAFLETSDQEFRQWAKSQGKAVQQQLQFGKMAVNAFPELAENKASIERAMGTGKFMNLMVAIGQAIGEDVAVGLGGESGFVDTPQQAKYKLDELKADKEFMAAYLNINGNHPGHDAAKAKFQRIMASAYPS